MLRNEIKYVLSEAQAAVLAARMRGLLAPDPHMTDPDGYRVSSLYFDDMNDSSYYEKLAGAEHRKKYRVRVYDGDTGCSIMLERKTKIGSKIEKCSIPLARTAFEGMTRGSFDALACEDSVLAREVLASNRARRLYPKVVVTYLREAYIHPLSNTRITFDKRLDAGWSPSALTGGEGESVYALPAPGLGGSGATVLEIKYDEYLPKFVSEALSHSGPPLAASKYVLCRDRLSQLGRLYTP